MRKLYRALTGTAAVVLGGLVACDDPLQVDNENNPDTERVLRRPTDVEQLIADSYKTAHRATLGSETVFNFSVNDAMQPQLLVMGLESYSSNANYGMAVRAGLPRTFVNNQRGNPVQAGNARDFIIGERAARTAAMGLRATQAASFSFGDKRTDSLRVLFRANAFARFVMGVAHGNLALAYDSAAIVSEKDEITALKTAADYNRVLPLVRYDSVMKYAISQLDSAEAIVNRATTPAGGHRAYTMDIPAAWLAQSADVSAANFLRIVRSYRARFRAQVARDSVSRITQTDWDKVIADAQNGITTDLNLNMNPANGWDVSWVIQHYLFLNWHQQPMPIIGMADTGRTADPENPSGPQIYRYEAWLRQFLFDRTPFLIQTPDQRFPSGNDRAAQLTSAGGSASNATPPRPNLYFRNRPTGNDVPGDAWATSFYDHFRFQSFYNASRIAAYPVMTRAEMNLLAAEGMLRRNRVAEAAVLIDSTRVGRVHSATVQGRGGNLPALTGVITALGQAVPGGTACVPRVPVGPSYTTTACGDIFEALKWEKRLETAFAGYGMWYFDGRGWGDNMQGTAVHFPVPYQEKDARGLGFRNVGGVGSTEGSPRSNYGNFNLY